jgi:hypothetical protein
MLAEIRAWRPGDEAQILDLFARCFPHAAPSLEHWRWKYERDPFGRTRISMAFADDGRLVGHYAAYPVLFREGERDVVGQQVGDTMTDVSVRHVGRGPSSVFGRTALHFYQTFCEGQVAFNYGFNVDNVQRFSIRFLRSERVEPVTYRVRDLRAHPLRPLRRAERWAGGWQLELVTAVGDEYDAFFERAAPHYGFLLRRDARYLRWRYFDMPGAEYIMVAIRKWRRLAGWLVFRIRDGRLRIGDALFDRRWPRAFELLLRGVVPSYPVEAVEGWLTRRPAWWDELLHEAQFEERPEPQDLSLMCAPFGMPAAAERMRQSLYYTWGDSDLF